MEISIYRRHTADCKHEKDRYAPRCGCPLWFQFNWPRASTSLDGKKLRHGQNKWSADTRTWAQAQINARKLEHDLNSLLDGKPIRNSVTITAAVNEWLEFRTKNGLSNTKAKLMGDKLTAWCEQNSILLLTAITTDLVIKFRMSLPFRTADSSSLSVHWSVISGFFSWSLGMGYIDKTPVPDSRQNPQFRIRYDKKEVVPPTRAQVEKVLHAATGKVKVLATLMRETAMALVDAQRFDPASLQDGTLIRGNRRKTSERYRVRISQSLQQQLEGLGSPAFPGTYAEWRERLYKAFGEAGVKMTPHGFRHFRISELLAQGVSVADVSKMVGTSEKEIRKTYEHWIKEAEDRLDEVQRQSWLAMGLDENGNERPQAVVN